MSSFKNCESLLVCSDENPKLVLKKKIFCLADLSGLDRFAGSFLMWELEGLQTVAKQNVKEKKPKYMFSSLQSLKIFITLLTELVF